MHNKNRILTVTFTLIWGLFNFNNTVISQPSDPPLTSLQQSFYTPPDSVRPFVYWYWINDHVSKEGVIRDLDAMQEVGIGGAFIGNIGLTPEEGTSYGDTKLFSDNWWSALRTAHQYAALVDVTLGMFNGPGWSQSGGPWVPEEHSMQYLSVDTFQVTGAGETIRMNLGHGGIYTTAIPKPKFHGFSLAGATISSTPRIEHLEKLIDSDLASSVVMIPDAGDGQIVIDIVLEAAIDARSIMIHTANALFTANAELQVRESTGYRRVKAFPLHRTNASLQVGFNPYPPFAQSFETASGNAFRLILTQVEGNCALSEISISPAAILENYPEKQLAKMYQSFLPEWDSYRWPTQPDLDDKALAVPSDQYLRLDEFVDAQGNLSWRAPQGEWLVLHYTLKPTGVVNHPASNEGRGLEIDRLNSEKLNHHFDHFMGRVLDSIPRHARTKLEYMVIDSYETGSQNWTDGMESVFTSRYGYDPIPWLPTLAGFIVESPEQSNRFLWDLRRLVADLIAYEYVGGLRNLANSHGMKLWLENYGHWGFPSEFLTYGGQSDEVAGEFWNEGELGNVENKLASSAAHIYGKRRVWSESFTAGGRAFERYPYLLKRRGDWSFAEGINQTLFHLYIHQPYEREGPGINTWFGTEFNRKNTWFSLSKDFVDYIRRCNFMLQQGNPVSDIAYFIGEDAPLMAGTRIPELPKGYDYDYINAEVLLHHAEVVDGELVLPHGVRYKLLVLPPLSNMRPAVFAKIKQLIADGAHVYGELPEKSPSLQDYPYADQQIVELTASLREQPQVKPGIRAIGKGYLINGIGLEETFLFMKLVPDFAVNTTSDSIRYVHRTIDGAELYFVSNQEERPVEFTASFRITDGVPHWWDPVSGVRRQLAHYDITDQHISIPIRLEVFESGFVVFDQSETPVRNTTAFGANANFPTFNAAIEISAPWRASFSADFPNAPADEVIFDELVPWEMHEDPLVRQYSGRATYRTTFDYSGDTETSALIRLGKIEGIAKVKLNGLELGTVWTAPWQIDTQDALKKGMNTLEIEVASTWVNHLSTNMVEPRVGPKTETEYIHFDPSIEHRKSGLLGPVVLGR